MHTRQSCLAAVLLVPISTMVNAAQSPATFFLRPSLDISITNICQAPEPVALLEVWVNDRTDHVIAHVERRVGFVYVNRSELAKAGITTSSSDADEDGLIELTRMNGIDARIDEARQRLILTTEAGRLAAQGFELKSHTRTPSDMPATGAIVSYDLSATAEDLGNMPDTGVFGASLGVTIFSPLGTLSSNGFTQSNARGARAVRLETTAEIDDADAMRRMIFGDMISGGLDWNRSVRMGGIQIARDFSLQPGYTTMPLPDFFGQSAVPGSVEVFVNSARVFGTDVAPGPFELRHLPVLTGANEARIVVRDELGRETVQTISLYGSNKLLGAGLTSFAFDAGFMRRGYGLKSFSYGDLATTGTYRRGITDWLTLEAHGEASQRVHLGGAGATVSLSDLGTVSANLAFSGGKSGSGALYGMSFESRSRYFGIFGSWSQASGNYADLASLGGVSSMQRRVQLGANLAVGSNSTLAASYIDFKDQGTPSSQLITASFTHNFATGWFFSTTGFYDRKLGSWRAEAFLSIPLHDDVMASVSASTGSAAASMQASIIKPGNPNGGVGYRLSSLQGVIDRTEGGATWYGDTAQIDGALSTSRGRVAGQVTASGGVVFLQGSIFATQRPEGAVALVQTGKPGVKIMRENRLVAVSDEDGEALVPQLTPNVPNRISVDTQDYSIATLVDLSEKSVVPSRKSGLIVDLRPPKRRPILISLALPDGAPPPAGSLVHLNGRDDKLVLGYRGKLFVADLSEPVLGVAEWTGGRCSFIAKPSAGDAQAAITTPVPLRCEMMANG